MALRPWTGRPEAEAKVSLDSLDRSVPCASEDTPKGTWIGSPLFVAGIVRCLVYDISYQAASFFTPSSSLQATLAERLEVSRQTINAIETGKLVCDVSAVKRTGRGE